MALFKKKKKEPNKIYTLDELNIGTEGMSEEEIARLEAEAVLEKYDKESAYRNKIKGPVAFVLGFTVTFGVLGAFAGTVGGLLRRYQTEVNLVCGVMVVFFGLNFLGVIRLGIFRDTGGMKGSTEMGAFSAFLFGVVFGLGWTPCIGAFLGSALMLASSQASWVQGILLLICYSAGLGIPFLISAVLIQKLKTTFDWIKRHYGIINKASGGLLILVGILMMTGLMNQYLVMMS